MNLALYREFRPTTFKGVIGQNHITRTLSNQVKSGELTHAYLFTGTRGTGKTSCAKIFSKAINCLEPVDGSPCGKCKVCEALDLPNTDVLEIDAASNNRVDEIRDLRERVKYPPTIARKKVYIIDEVHMLTESAFNALLKTLEEPPEYVVFILATTEVHKLPATILSRCTRFDFRLLTTEELVQHLRYVFDEKHIQCDDNSLYLIATQGAGSVRDTLSIADSVSAFCEKKITYDKCLEVLGITSNEGITKLVNNIIDGNIQGIFSEVKNILNRGKNITLLCKETTEYFKNLLLIQAGIKDFNTLNIMPNELELMASQANKLDTEVVKRGFDKFARVELDFKYSVNPQNLFEAVCISLIKSQTQTQQNIVANVQPASSVIQNNVVSNQNVTPSNGLNQSVVPSNNVAYNNIQSTNLKNNVVSNNNTSSMNISNSNVSFTSEIDRLWGSVLLEIKKRNMFALSSSLRDIYGVHMAGNCLVLQTNDQSILKMIDEPAKLDVILNIASSLNSNIKKVEIHYDEANKSSKDVVAELKNIFMDKLKVKE
ncbi:MAG: DNA polymerase III subunit gamma/tau [Clostridia bacterium]|nr:DNA polymerase III subunit gamma/tau [Clostridia bacterium]